MNCRVCFPRWHELSARRRHLRAMTGRFGGSTRLREPRVFEWAGRQSPQSGGRPSMRTALAGRSVKSWRSGQCRVAPYRTALGARQEWTRLGVIDRQRSCGSSCPPGEPQDAGLRCPRRRRPCSPLRKSRLLVDRASFVPVRRSVSRDAGQHAPPPPGTSRERLLPRVPRDLLEADGWRRACTESRVPAVQLRRLDSGLPSARADDGASLAAGRGPP